MMTSGLNNGRSKASVVNMSTPLKIMWSFQPLKHTPSTKAISQFQMTADLAYCSWFQFHSYNLVVQKTVSEGARKRTSINKIITTFFCPVLRLTAFVPSVRFCAVCPTILENSLSFYLIAYLKLLIPW